MRAFEKRFFLLLVLAVMLLPSVFAARGNFFEPVDRVITDINPNPDLGLSEVRDNPTIWVFSVFTIMFAIIFAGSSFVPMFKEQRGPRVAFSIVIAILTVFVPGPIAVMAGLGVVILIVFLILALFFIFFTIMRDFLTGYTEAGTRGQRASADNAAARAERERAERELRRLRDEDEASRRHPRTTTGGGTGGGGTGGGTTGGGGTGGGGTGGESEEDDEDLARLLRELFDALTRYEHLIGEYDRMTRELIGHLKHQLSIDSGYYFEHPTVNFDIAHYHGLIHKINDTENEIIKIIDNLNHNNSWSGTAHERTAVGYIENFEELLVMRRKITLDLEAQINEMVAP